MNDDSTLAELPPGLRLDLSSRQLLSDGRAVELTLICFSMLSYFVQNPGRLITKQELLDNIWAEVFVEEGAVKGYVRKLRQILNDVPKRPRYIETARGLGYRYIGDIAMCGHEEVRPAALVDRDSRLTIAVLAFTNMGADQGKEYFSDGISEDIITDLSRFPMLSVIARHSSFAFKGERIDVKEVGRKLGADYLVEGSVRLAGERLRITAQLIDVETESHIWAERYDREVQAIFEVQDDVTRSIVATIAAKLGQAVSEGAARKPPADIKSYEYLLQASRRYYRFNPAENVAAAGLYEKAIERDPQSARAHSGLANAYLTDHFLGWFRIAGLPE